MAKDQQRPVQRCPKGALFLESESASPGGRGLWYARVPPEHTLDDVLSPSYFGMLQGTRAPREGDVIDIEPEHRLWFVRVTVLAVVPKLQQIRTREMQGLRQSYAAKPPTGYSFVWKGDKGRWAILRGEIEIDAGFVTQDEALARIEELQKEKAA